MIINCNFSLFHLAKAKNSKFGNWHKTKTLVFCDHSKFSNVNKIIFIVLSQFYWAKTLTCILNTNKINFYKCFEVLAFGIHS